MQRWVVFRVLAAAGLASAALAVGLPAASGRPTAGHNNCANPDTSTHWEAVFAHTSSASQALPIQRALAVKGFKGIQFEMDSCDDLELEVSGVDSPAQRLALAREADRVAVPVSFESQDEQKQNRAGEVTAVFGTLPTLKRASTLQGAIAVKGWRESDIVRLSLHSWRVVVAHIPAGAKAGFAAEARRAGYRVTFVSG